MLQIRPSQLDAFTAPLEETYIERLVDFLQEEFPDARDDSRDELRAGVRPLVRRARRYDLTTEVEIAKFVLCGAMLGPEFDDTFDAAQRILTDQERTPTERADDLADWASSLFKTEEERLQ